jgi:hypothetical protein
MKTKLLTIATLAVLMLTATIKGQAQTPCLPQEHGLTTHQSAMCGVTQSIALTSGWNWFSLPIEAENSAAALQMLEGALDGNALTITSGTGQYTEYDDEDEEWFGNLTGIANENMYMINMANDYTISLEGQPANPASHQITINPGWNWIGFPSNVEISVVAAFADFEAEEDDELRGREGATIFDGEEWFGFLDTLTPGHGYMYFFNGSEPKPLVIPTGAKARRIPGLGNPKK